MASVLLYAIAIVAVSAVTIIECLINKRDYAVFIINGISRRAVYFMIVVKNALLICVPAVVVWVYRQWKIFMESYHIIMNLQVNYHIWQQRCHIVYMYLP